MRKTKTKQLHQIMSKLMKHPKIRKRLQELDVIEIWDDIIGKDLKKYIKDASFSKKTITVRFSSSVLRNELSYKKKDIIDKINKKIGKDLVKDIEFR